MEKPMIRRFDNLEGLQKDMDEIEELMDKAMAKHPSWAMKTLSTKVLRDSTLISRLKDGRVSIRKLSSIKAALTKHLAD